jgi:hypothetical protein
MQRARGSRFFWQKLFSSQPEIKSPALQNEVQGFSSTSTAIYFSAFQLAA